jgi:hypothetical protein
MNQVELGEKAILESNRYQQLRQSKYLGLQELMNRAAILESNRYQQLGQLGTS